jgi:hypothetical protein
MEEILQIHLNFNEESSKILLKKYFKYIWKKGIKAIIRNIFYIICFGFLFYLTIIGQTENGLQYIFGAILIFMIAILYVQTYHYISSRKRYYRSIETYIKEQKFQKVNKSIILSDNSSLSLKDSTFEIKALWTKTSYFHIDADTLVISFNISNKILFLIDNKDRSEDIQKLIQKLENYSKKENH